MTDRPEVVEAEQNQPEPLVLGTGPQDLIAAAEAIRSGGCIVLPTDTVYGIAADAFSSSAVQRLLDAKQRGADMPPPVLIAEPGMLRALAIDVPTAAHDLAQAFWPGALTLILKSQRTLELKIGDTGGTVAVRVPDHAVARDLLRRTGPLAVSSANISKQPPAVRVEEAVGQLGATVAVYIDGGEAPGGVPSTIVDFSLEPKGRILRQGAISFDELSRVAPELIPASEPRPDEETRVENGGQEEPALTTAAPSEDGGKAESTEAQ